jgi:hypothetical protein
MVRPPDLGRRAAARMWTPAVFFALEDGSRYVRHERELLDGIVVERLKLGPPPAPSGH